MTDTVSKEKRSEIMARVSSKDTQPEMVVRSLTHGMGYRYRLHDKKLPGKPDLVFASRKKVIFVHGCFWHRHQSKACKRSRMPNSNREYWKAKFASNVSRDKSNLRKLRKLGWRPLVIWECELRDKTKLERRIARFLDK